MSPPGQTAQTLPRIQELVASASGGHQQPLLQLDLNGSSSPRGSYKNHHSRFNNNEEDDVDRNFDLSPDMPCPPVPPRRFQTAAEALAAIQISPPPMSPPSSSSSTSASPYRNYNHFLQQLQASKATSPPAPPPLKATHQNLDLDEPGDDDQLMITLTPNNTTVAPSSQIVLESTVTATGTTTTTTTLPRPSQHHHKPPAPQPPQRPPLAPKPTTLRKESRFRVERKLSMQPVVNHDV